MASLAQLWNDGWCLLLVVLLVSVLLGTRLGRWTSKRREVKRARRGRRLGDLGERRGVKLLERRGFEILELEVVGECILEVDGELERFPIRVDALVRKGRRRYVAEFKGTNAAASLRNRKTRRQVIEYALAFGDRCEAVLLVDSEAGTVCEVRLRR